MTKTSLIALAREQCEVAQTVSSGRSARTAYGGHEHVLRQTVIALIAGAVLGEHDNSGEATIYVLSGRIRVSSGVTDWDGSPGDLLVVPQARHSLTAIEPSAFLLTVVKTQPDAAVIDARPA